MDQISNQNKRKKEEGKKNEIGMEIKNCDSEVWPTVVAGALRGKMYSGGVLSASTELMVKTQRHPASTANSMMCGHETQQQQLQQQRCSSTGSSICDSLSSHSALSPTESLPLAIGVQLPSPQAAQSYRHHPPFSFAPTVAKTTTTNTSPPDTHDKIDILEKRSDPATAMQPPPPPQEVLLIKHLPDDEPVPPSPNRKNTAPSGFSAVASPASLAGSNGRSAPAAAALIGDLGAAAMAVNLAESFTLLHQQAHHFRDMLYAAHLFGRGKNYFPLII